MAMERSAQVLNLNQSWKRSGGRGFELTAILSQLRRDVIEIQCAIQVSLLMHFRNNSSSDLFVFGCCLRWSRRHSIFVERPSSLQSPVPEHDVVLFAASKIVEGKRVFLSGHNSQIALNTRAQADTRFRWPLRDN